MKILRLDDGRKFDPTKLPRDRHWGLLRFETENHAFEITIPVKNKYFMVTGFTEISEAVESGFGFRLTRVLCPMKRSELFTNENILPLPEDSGPDEWCEFIFPAPVVVEIRLLTKGREIRGAEDKWRDLFERFFDPPAPAGGWKFLQHAELSIGLLTERKYRKSQRHIDRTLAVRADQDVCLENLRAVMEKYQNDWVQTNLPGVDGPIDPAYYHSGMKAWIISQDERQSESEPEFVKNRYLDRRLQVSGELIFRFSASELKYQESAQKVIGEVIGAVKRMSQGNFFHYQPVRIELAAKKRLQIFPLSFRLKQNDDLESIATGIETGIDWRVIRIVQSGDDGLPMVEWTNLHIDDRPMDKPLCKHGVVHGSFGERWINIVSNGEMDLSSEFLHMLSERFTDTNGEVIHQPKVVKITTNFRGGSVPSHNRVRTRLRGKGVDSKLEGHLLNALRLYGMDPVLQQDIYYHGILLTSLDFCFPDKHLAIMVDGHRWHSSPEAVIKDRVQDRRLQLLGWRVLRYPDRSIIGHLDKCVKEIQEALAK